MGQITITVSGSFSRYQKKTFSALKNGHADAVAQALEWLAGEVLPAANAQDHDLHLGGQTPENGFRRK